MALTRRFLSALGIEAEKIDQIIEAHTESLEGVKSDRDKYKALVDDNQKELDELKKQAETNAKNSEGKDYDALKAEYEKYKAEREAEKSNSAKESALKELLADMKMSDKGSKQVLKWMGVSKIELDESGKIKDAANLRKSIKDDWGDYIQSEGAQGADTSTPPEHENSGTKMSKEEILKIKDRSARQKAISDNHELFGY